MGLYNSVVIAARRGVCVCGVGGVIRGGRGHKGAKWWWKRK